MGLLKAWRSLRKSKANIKKKKAQVADVRSLHKLKRGGGGSMKSAERQGAMRAAGRLGDSMAAYPVRTKRGK
jgi:hypothetical protein